MYSEPKGSGNHSTWVNEWLRVLLEVSEIKNIHLINKSDLRLVAPFNRLDEEAFESLLTDLMKTDYLVYWGKGNIRIYWRSIQAWSEILVERAKEADRLVIFGLDAFKEINPVMSKIPQTDQVKILQTLVDQGKARWMEKDNYIIKIH